MFGSALWSTEFLSTSTSPCFYSRLQKSRTRSRLKIDSLKVRSPWREASLCGNTISTSQISYLRHCCRTMHRSIQNTVRLSFSIPSLSSSYWARRRTAIWRYLVRNLQFSCRCCCEQSEFRENYALPNWRSVRTKLLRTVPGCTQCSKLEKFWGDLYELSVLRPPRCKA